ncbi:MAG: RNA-directed DNA polymerase [Proteobacteria bacterium]|nr:RNA-directed DNA polymerase [Pseudomonadota bacterium]
MPPSLPNRHPLHQSRLYAVQSRAKLAALFGLTRVTLHAVLAEERPFSLRATEITRNGKTKARVIQEPRGNLRPIHIVVRKMLTRIEPPEFLFCPVKQRSYVSNAALHVRAKEIRKLDIHAYFPSTPSYRVYWFFHTVMACSPDVAEVLAKLLTVDGHLATGSTVSPILSFFAFYDMWLAIAQIAKEAGCLLSVYMDDIAVSGDIVPDRVIWQIKQQVHSRDLIAHKERRYTGGIGEVTGALIKDGKLQVPNRQLKKTYKTRMALAATNDPAEIVRLSSVLRGLNQQRTQIEG